MRSENEGLPESIPGTGAEWVVLFHSGEMTPDARHALHAWRAASVKNDTDFRKAEAVWRLTGELAGDPAIQAELEQLRRKLRAGDDAGNANPAPRSMSSRTRLAAAAAILVSLATATLLVSSQNTDWHDTARGGHHRVSLPDGSSIEINTDSRVGVRYSAEDRDLTLEKGEVLFEVAHDPVRPFTVRARNGHVRALGTRFNIVAENDLVTVTLLQGRAEVVARGDAGEQRTELGKGESIAYGRNGVLVPADPATASSRRIEGWRNGKWSFDGWPIERAVREHNRYASKPVRLGSAGLGQKQISGQFLISDPEAFVAAVAVVAGAEVIDQGDSLLLVPVPDTGHSVPDTEPPN